MKTALKATAIAAALAAMTAAGAAQAAVTVSFTGADLPLPAGQQLVWNFDGLQAAGYGVTLSGGAGIYDGSLGLISGIAAPPPGATSHYAAVLGGGKLTLTTPLISQLSIYMGSPDDYNQIRFNFVGGGSETLTGQTLAAGGFGGNQSVGRRMTYNFGGQKVTSVEFMSSGNSFEFDNIATVSAVPEPATWAMMITGFGLAGAAMRRRRASLAFA
jgi:hypothetical protein